MFDALLVGCHFNIMGKFYKTATRFCMDKDVVRGEPALAYKKDSKVKDVGLNVW